MKKQVLLAITMCAFVAYAGGAIAGGNVKAGKVKATTCKNCHGPAFEGKDAAPKLAGLDEAHTVKQLEDFKSGARKSMMMGMFVSSLDHTDMADLAAYFASLK